MTLDRIDPAFIALLPPLRALVPPAVVIDKQHYSPFVEPVLHRHLQKRGIENLVISGGETDVCVLATVLGAVDLGYRVVVVSDALCSVSDTAHDTLMLLYRERFSQQIEVASVDTVLAAWA